MELANGRIITAREATIKTATVAVKALTISGKQVTLSVFRQLIKEPLIDGQTGLLAGVPWGIVNYFWGPCTNNHLHVVWQKGEELRRACVYDRPPGENRWNRQDMTRSRYDTAAKDAETALGVWAAYTVLDGKLPNFGSVTDGGRVVVATTLGNGREVTTTVPKAVYRLAMWPKSAPKREEKYDYDRRGYVPTESEDAWRERVESARREAVVEVEAFVEAQGRWEQSAALLAREFLDFLAEQRRFRRSWEESYETVAALDQLFIAV